MLKRTVILTAATRYAKLFLRHLADVRREKEQ